MRVSALVWLILAGSAACEEVKDYRGSHIFSVNARTKDDVIFLHNLIETYDLQVLRESSQSSIELIVGRDEINWVTQVLNDAGLTFTVQHSDLQQQIDAERRENLPKRGRHSRWNELPFYPEPFPNHKSYYPLHQINKYLHNFAANYSDLAVLKTLNQQTHENRTVYYLEIGSREGGQRKPVILIESLTHAREWVAGAAVLYTIDKMLQGYGNDSDITHALDTYTWVIVPVVNPDGYRHTWKADRMWRKNRRPISERCFGVDLNRNYDVMWGTTGVSDKCGTDIYPGKAAFSEPETQNIRDLFRSLKPRVVGFLAVHAFSQLLLHPWGYIDSEDTSEKPDNLQELIRVGELIMKQLPNYRFGTAFGVLEYGGSGSSNDWALQDKPGIYSYTYELRPSSWEEGHFLLPSYQIRPTGRELMQSMLVMSQNIKINNNNNNAILFP